MKEHSFGARRPGELDVGTYRAIFELSPEAIVLLDRRGRFIAANGRLEDWLGYPPDDLRGTSLIRAPFIPRASKLVIVRNFMRRMAGKDISPYELAFTTRSGETRYGRIHGKIVKDASGRALGDLVMISDVTELKEAQESLIQRSRQLGERVKELTCLHEISKLEVDPALSLDELLSRVVRLLPPAFQHPEVTESRVRLGDRDYATDRFRETERMLTRDILSQGEVVGRLDVCYLKSRADGGTFLPEEENLVETVAERVGHMVSRARMQEELRDGELRFRRKIEGLHEAAMALGRAETRDDACRLTVEAARDVLGFPVCVAHMTVGDGLVVRSACSELPPGVELDETTGEDSPAMQAFREGRTVVSGEGSGSACSGCPGLFRSSVCVPISGIGVFEVLSPDEDAFDGSDVRLLELLLGHTREAMRGIALREELEQEVVRDPLTGLFNRRYLRSILDQEVERARRYGHRIGFLMVDVDRFKEINDTLGHQVGDLVLRQVSRYLRAMVRATEFVVRYGGDEFLIVMPESGADGRAVVHRLQRAFEPWSEEFSEEGLHLRLSMGFDVWEPAAGRTIAQVIESADERMYEDKRQRGDDRSAVAAEEPDEGS